MPPQDLHASRLAPCTSSSHSPHISHPLQLHPPPPLLIGRSIALLHVAATLKPAHATFLRLHGSAGSVKPVGRALGASARRQPNHQPTSRHQQGALWCLQALHITHFSWQKSSSEAQRGGAANHPFCALTSSMDTSPGRTSSSSPPAPAAPGGRSAAVGRLLRCCAQKAMSRRISASPCEPRVKAGVEGTRGCGPMAGGCRASSGAWGGHLQDSCPPRQAASLFECQEKHAQLPRCPPAAWHALCPARRARPLPCRACRAAARLSGSPAAG